ncbi:MAG TPA: hypothetical protein VHK88_10230 [Aquihabitans sp.]|nr:hypothetical protein [Aquihabitans sp.]
MGEKGNLPAETASAALGQRAAGVAGNLVGVAATKTVEVTVEGVVKGAAGQDDETTDAEGTDGAGRDSAGG